VKLGCVEKLPHDTLLVHPCGGACMPLCELARHSTGAPTHATHMVLGWGKLLHSYIETKNICVV